MARLPCGRRRSHDEISAYAADPSVSMAAGVRPCRGYADDTSGPFPDSLDTRPSSRLSECSIPARSRFAFMVDRPMAESRPISTFCWSDLRLLVHRVAAGSLEAVFRPRCSPLRALRLRDLSCRGGAHCARLHAATAARSRCRPPQRHPSAARPRSTAAERCTRRGRTAGR